MSNAEKGQFTCGRKSFITATFPYKPISFNALNPSGVTRYISKRVFFATIKFKSFGDVKFPVILNVLIDLKIILGYFYKPVTQADTAVGLCAVTT